MGTTSSRPVKKRHDLFACADGPAFVRALSSLGIELDALLARFVAPGAQVGVLLVGSLPDGTGTPESDVDLMVLAERAADLIAPKDALLLTARGGRREYIEYPLGLEVNLELVTREGTRTLVSDFLAAAPALYSPKQVKSLPMFEEFDLRFLHRLRSGWPLVGQGLVEDWRDELMIELLPIYTALRNYVLFQRYQEDAHSMQGRFAGAVAHIGRIAVEFGLHSLVGHKGFTGQNKKFLLHYCSRVTDPEARAVIELGLKLLFPRADLSTDEEARYLADLDELQRRIEALYMADPELSRGIRFLGSKIVQVDEPPEPTRA